MRLHGGGTPSQVQAQAVLEKGWGESGVGTMQVY